MVSYLVSHPPSVFGQLVYIASLRDKNGSYQHPAVCREFGGEAADHALRQQHKVTFQAWLALPLEQQCAELEAYLHAIGGEDRALHGWSGLAVTEDLIPEAAEAHESQLFQSDLQILLPMLIGDLQAAASREEPRGREGGWLGRLVPGFGIFGRKTERKGVDSVLKGMPRRDTLLHRTRRSEELKDLRDRGQINDAEFITALNMLRAAEGLPPLPSSPARPEKVREPN
jgi:hypothetical protein